MISCPTGQSDCAIAPNITLTEGTDLAKWTSTTSGADVAGYVMLLAMDIAQGLSTNLTNSTVAINCPSLTTDFPITCHQNAIGGGQVRSTSQVLESSDVVYQAVDVTATMNNTATIPSTVTVTAFPSPPTTTSSTSTAGATTMAGRVWGAAGAVGGGFAALMAL